MGWGRAWTLESQTQVRSPSRTRVPGKLGSYWFILKDSLSSSVKWGYEELFPRVFPHRQSHDNDHYNDLTKVLEESRKQYPQT